MKKLYSALILIVIAWQLTGCEVKDPTQPQLVTPQQQLVLSKMVAIGNSLTAGFQSAGLVEEFQLHSYPYLIAKQMGRSATFEQPLIASPGIGSTPGKTPLKLVNGNLVAEDLTVDPATLLKNALLPRPYDNLGVPGAALVDVMQAYDASTAKSGPNPFFDIVLRNPNFGNTSQLQQAILLNPSLIILWIGNNDVLGAALAGGDVNRITPQDVFKSQFTTLLSELRQKTRAAIVMANIPYVTDIPFINTLDGIFRPVPAMGISKPVPVVFTPKLEPVDFATSGNEPVYLPLLTQETNVAHLTLAALVAYANGIGVPDSARLVAMGFDAALAQGIVQAMKAAGLNPTGLPLPGSVTLTAEEVAQIRQAVDGFNATLEQLAAQFKVVLVDMNEMLTRLNQQGIDGFNGKFVLVDPVNTAFSLDGVHPNHAGYAIVANVFIRAINQAFQLSIPEIDTQQFRGQYAPTVSARIVHETIRQAQAIFR